MMNIWTYIIVLFASLLKGITGFGFALVTLPLLLYWYDAKLLIPVLMICNLISSIGILLQKKERTLVNHKYRILIFCGALFTGFGVFILSSLSEKFLLFVLGIFFIVLSLLSLGNVKKVAVFPTSIYCIIGSLIGLLTGTISVSGPPLALFLRKTGVDNQEFREIFAWFSVVTAVISVVAYWHVGLLSEQTFAMCIRFVPILIVGNFVGKQLNKVLPALVFQQICVAVTIVSSILILIK